MGDTPETQEKSNSTGASGGRLLGGITQQEEDMPTRTRLLIVVALALAVVAPGPPPAQAGANLGLVPIPAFLGVADKGVLAILTNADFSSCAVSQPMFPPIVGPGLDLWSFNLAFEDAAGEVGIPPVILKLAITPKGAVNGYWHQTMRARVYTGSETLIADFLASPCTFYNSGPLVAEGFVEMLYESADDGLAGPGVNSWGLNVKGTLEDVAGQCSSGSVEYRLLRRWILRTTGPEFVFDKVTASKGPSLTCAR